MLEFVLIAIDEMLDNFRGTCGMMFCMTDCIFSTIDFAFMDVDAALQIWYLIFDRLNDTMKNSPNKGFCFINGIISLQSVYWLQPYLYLLHLLLRRFLLLGLLSFTIQTKLLEDHPNSKVPTYLELLIPHWHSFHSQLLGAPQCKESNDRNTNTCQVQCFEFQLWFLPSFVSLRRTGYLQHHSSSQFYSS